MWPNVGRTQVVEDGVIFNKQVQFRVPPIFDPDPAAGFQFKWDAVNSRILARDVADSAGVPLAANGFFGSDGTPLINGVTNITYLRNGSYTTNNGIAFTTTSFGLRNDISLGWYSTDPSGGTIDVSLFRDAANIIAQRNGVNNQIFCVYGTYTDSSNWERGIIGWNCGAFRIGSDKL